MSERRYLTVSDALAAAADILAKRRHYRNFPEYVTALIRYDGQTQMDHHLTAEWACLDAEERDRLDAGILAHVKEGKKVRGSWLLARLQAIIEIITGMQTSGEAPTPDLVAKELAKRENPPR